MKTMLLLSLKADIIMTTLYIWVGVQEVLIAIHGGTHTHSFPHVSTTVPTPHIHIHTHPAPHFVVYVSATATTATTTKTCSRRHIYGSR